MPLYTHAIVRDVPDAYAECLTLEAIEVPIDVPKAREQHAHFCAILAGLGLEVTRLEADETLPDCCFIEDTAVLVDDLAILTNPGAPSRIKEVEAVEQALRGIKPLAKILPPGTLDGGDVLVIGKTIYIGQSTRTNEAGIRQFAALVEPNGYTVVSVPVSGLLHLKSAVTYLGNGQGHPGASLCRSLLFQGIPPAEIVRSGGLLRQLPEREWNHPDARRIRTSEKTDRKPGLPGNRTGHVGI
ncbi:MAG: N(G),N(G)-dimethylarginine dimethylaminohydrolase [Haliscomenobacter sp.]|nr:N(G),N(G)-dimethylarginine dimethylaminohydrolase [Haliscomenobacter sp.]